ncbi:hypothetical protein [Gymnodinialimonas hymeniacidonis]|uniref:hypothetical protein n=1 Tax=Gymnodinialimonas hymeniacidonis TaxID=3126508 RepID=UPI0034C65EDB
MIRLFALLLSVFAAGPAMALSCLQPTVAGAYTNAADSPADYVIGAGSLTLTGPSNPPHGLTMQGDDPNQMVGYTQPARFDGGLFTGADFNNQQTLSVTVDVTCIAAWCGAASPVDYGLLFFRVVNGTYILDEGACPANVFHDVHPGMLQEVIDCHQGTCPGFW